MPGPQVPDIYDAAKYDAIHNQHLGLDLRPVYKVRLQNLKRRRTMHTCRRALSAPSSWPAALLLAFCARAKVNGLNDQASNCRPP